jgi:SAM-dependent methyltransferase
MDRFADSSGETGPDSRKAQPPEDRTPKQLADAAAGNYMVSGEADRDDPRLAFAGPEPHVPIERAYSFGAQPDVYHEGREHVPFAPQTLDRAVRGLSAGTRVLDIGAGTGRGAARLLRRYPELGLDITCLEPDPAMLKVLEAKLGDQVTIVAGRAEDISARSESGKLTKYGLVIGFDSLHWPEFAIFDQQLPTVLEPGGRLVAINNIVGICPETDALTKATIIVDNEESWENNFNGETNGVPFTGEWGEPYFENFSREVFSFEKVYTSEEVFRVYKSYPEFLTSTVQAKLIEQRLKETIAEFAKSDGTLTLPTHTHIWEAYRKG